MKEYYVVDVVRVVFGSTECQHCSNTWIASIGIYLVAGPLLIYLLFALRLTITTGTLNGIIFCAQGREYSHCILIIVTLIVVVGLLLPNVLLLLFTIPLRPLACTNKYLRPLLEVIHASYKEGK